MPNPIQAGILVALLKVLKPIVRALLRSGIGFREFSNVAKATFVEVATEDFGLRGRPTNISRVAVMTGLTRKEVKRLRKTAPPDQSAQVAHRSLPADLLHLWHTDSEYIDVTGAPKVLPYEGNSVSFYSLIKRCAGDVPPGAMRAELKRVGAVVERENGELEAVKRHFIPSDIDEKFEFGLNLGLAPLASTLVFNCDPDRKEPARYQQMTNGVWIDRNNLLMVQDGLAEKLGGFLTDVDQYFSKVDGGHGNFDKTNFCQVGVGMFFYVEEAS
jgi:hypothetical protein